MAQGIAGSIAINSTSSSFCKHAFAHSIYPACCLSPAESIAGPSMTSVFIVGKKCPSALGSMVDKGAAGSSEMYSMSFELLEFSTSRRACRRTFAYCTDASDFILEKRTCLSAFFTQDKTGFPDYQYCSSKAFEFPLIDAFSFFQETNLFGKTRSNKNTFLFFPPS